MRALRSFGFIAIVLALFMLGDRAAAFVLDKIVSRSEFRFSRIYRGGLDYDVLIIGNSRAVHSVFAPELGERLCRPVFNIAYNGMSSEIAEAVLEDYLDHNRPPKAVLIEVSNATVDNDLLKEMRLYARDGTHVAALLAKDDPRTAIWTAISHLYRFNDELMLRAAYYLGHDDQDWSLGDKPVTAEVIAHLRPEWYPDPRLRPEGVAALRRMTHLLKARHIEPVLYVAPYHPAYRRFVPDYAQWVHDLQREIGDDVAIADLSQFLSRDEDFTDLIHVNRRGSRDLMDAVVERLTDALAQRTASQCAPRRTVASTAHP